MTRPRIIPCLLLDGQRLVKTRGFAAPVYVGDPINAIRIFNEKEVDELMLIDISASREGRGPDIAFIEDLAGECFMPLCYGGGIRGMDDALPLFAAGIEKVCLQSTFYRSPDEVRRIADHAGEQAVMVSIDVTTDASGRRVLRQPAGGRADFVDWQSAMRAATVAGAGEILFTDADRDGGLGGLNLPLIAEASALVDVPLIAAGGANSLADMRGAVEAGASAVAAGAYFVFYGPHRAVLITYPTPSDLETLAAGETVADA